MASNVFLKGLERLTEVPDLVLDAPVVSPRLGDGVITAVDPTQGFYVKFRLEGRPVWLPKDAFFTGALRFPLAAENARRDAIITLGRAQAAALPGRGRPTLDPFVGPTAPPPRAAPTPSSTPSAAARTPLETAIEVLLSPKPVSNEVAVNALVGLPVVTTTGRPVRGTVTAVRWPESPALSRGQVLDTTRYELWVLTINRPGQKPTSVNVNYVDFLEQYAPADDVPPEIAARVIGTANAIQAEYARLRDVGEAAARERAGIRRLAGTETGVRRAAPSVVQTAQQALLGVSRGAGQSAEDAENRAALAFAMAQRQNVAVGGITWYIAGLGYMLDPFSEDPALRETSRNITMPEVVKLMKKLLPGFNDAYREAQAAWAEHRTGKAPQYPYSVVVLELTNGERREVDPRSYQVKTDPEGRLSPSDYATETLRTAITLPKVSRTHPDTIAANELRDNLARMGATESGPGGRSYASDALRAELQGMSGRGYLAAADPRLEGQVRSAVELYRHRGPSKFLRMRQETRATTPRETPEDRLARAEALGYPLTQAEYTDVSEAMRIYAGERITASASQTAFKRKITLKPDEEPTGQYIRVAGDDVLILGTERVMAEPRAQEFLRRLGLTPELVEIGGATSSRRTRGRPDLSSFFGDGDED